MMKFSLALAVALIAGSAIVSSAQAGFYQSYGGYAGGGSGCGKSAGLAARRQAIAQSRAKARAQAHAQAEAKAASARRLAAKRSAAARVQVAKFDTGVTSDVAPAVVVPDAPISTAALSESKAETKALEAVAEKPVQITKIAGELPATAKKICRKFSAAVGNLIEIPCE